MASWEQGISSLSSLGFDGHACTPHKHGAGGSRVGGCLGIRGLRLTLLAGSGRSAD